MNFKNFLNKENIFVSDYYEDTDSFYADFALFLKERGIIKDKKKVKRLFIKRENIQSTAIGKGAAAPHIFSDEFSEFTLSIALIKNGVDFKAPDGGKIFLIFLIMSDEKDVGMHLKTLAHIARFVKTTDIVSCVKKSKNAEEIFKTILKKEKLIQ